MKQRKFLPCIIAFFMVVCLFLPFTTTFAAENTPTVHAPVALLMDSRNW